MNISIRVIYYLLTKIKPLAKKELQERAWKGKISF